MAFAREVVIVDYLRSGFSRSRPKDQEKDQLNTWRMDDLAGKLMSEIVKRTKINPAEIDECIVGTSDPYLETYTGGGRFPVFLGKLPVSIAAQQVDSACASSFNGVRTAAMSIACGFADVVFACGIEHMSHVHMPGVGPGTVIPSKLFDDPEYKYLDPDNIVSMGLTAEKLLSQTSFTREDMDKYAVRSHQLASKSQKDGYFKDEIMPVEITVGGEKQIYDYDACIRADASVESLMALKPAFKQGGQITAGNSSPMNAGATCMLVMSREKANKLGLKPMASLVSFGVAGVEPSVMGKGPVPATQKALKTAGLKISDIDYFEINEAFSIVALNAIKELSINIDRVNIHGGALAIGHPLGASGVRLIGTLARILKQEGGTYGCANMCVGWGQGSACVIKKE